MKNLQQMAVGNVFSRRHLFFNKKLIVKQLKSIAILFFT